MIADRAVMRHNLQQMQNLLGTGFQAGNNEQVAELVELLFRFGDMWVKVDVGLASSELFLLAQPGKETDLMAVARHLMGPDEIWWVSPEELTITDETAYTASADPESGCKVPLGPETRTFKKLRLHWD